MSTIEQSVEVDVPLRTAYNQWTQFEEFPSFMEGVEEVRQVDDQMTHWRVRMAGVTREFDARITEHNRRRWELLRTHSRDLNLSAQTA